MTRFEKNIFAFFASLFGEKPARKIMRFGVDIITVLAFAGYLCTPPFRFVYYFSKNMRKACETH